jgi:hypothetical protein
MAKVLVCLLFTFFIGCAGVTIKDDLPPSSPKGYADFANYSLGYDVIYSMQEGKEVREGSLTYKGEVLRLARTPGSYDFIIEHRDDSGHDYRKTVKVNIMRDMLTFITIDNRIVEVEDFLSDRSEATLITYNVRISLAKTHVPVNIESEPNKMDIVKDLLNDPDWRARLYALGLLKKMGNSSDENLINRVRTLATDDPHRSVRGKADIYLKGLGIDVAKNMLLLENFEANNRTWINSRGGYDFFYNDEFLFRSREGGCENEIMRSSLELPREFDIELVSTWIAGTDSNAYGIFIGSDENNFDHFGISRSGQAVVRPVRNNGSAADLIAWTTVPSIGNNGAAHNRLRVEVRGDTWKYYVNGEYVGMITNTLKMDRYVIGLRVCEKQTIAFEQLKISRVREKPAGHLIAH